MTKQECINWVESHMEVKYATSNGAYQSGRKISPKGCVNHSVGCAQPSADVFYNLMNKSSAGWGVNAILGDFNKGDGRIMVVLPLDARPWGCGSGENGSWNNSRIQWEVCEPAGHTYAGGTMINYDVQKNATYFNRMWKMLVAWNVYLIEKFGYSVDGIADHAESYRAGYGSNHSDMGQWLPKHGKSMAALREEVKAILNEKTESEDEDMTLDQFKKLYREMLNEEKGDNPSAWAKEACEAAKEAGIFGGDGKGNFNWQDPITRESISAVLKRAGVI